jgi:hypothetical protein
LYLRPRIGAQVQGEGGVVGSANEYSWTQEPK